MKCKICKDDMFQNENCFGKPLEYRICGFCWEGLTKKEIKEYVKDGVVPITSIPNDTWRNYVKKFGMTI